MFTFCVEKSYEGTHLAFGETLDRRCNFKHVSLEPLSNEHASQVKDQGQRQCCHNKNKKFPYRPTRDVSLLSGLLECVCCWPCSFLLRRLYTVFSENIIETPELCAAFDSLSSWLNCWLNDFSHASLRCLMGFRGHSWICASHTHVALVYGVYIVKIQFCLRVTSHFRSPWSQTCVGWGFIVCILCHSFIWKGHI